MKKTLVLLFSIWVGVCTFSFGNSTFHNLQETRYLLGSLGETLEGISVIDVVIEEFNERVEEIGLTKNRLRTVTELRLRREGIKISRNVDPYMKVNVNVVGNAFNVSIEIKEAVKLIRIKNAITVATIYRKSVTGTYGDRSDNIISGLSIVLDEFLNDYYKANPKKK